MSKDNVTVLHNRDKPLPAFAPEFTIAQVTGYATTEDGQTCVLRTLTPEGIELRMVVPTLQVEALVGGLRAVKMMAAAKMNIEGSTTAVFTPAKYETITTSGYDGVLLAFDRGMQSEMIVGLDHDAAFNLGQHLRRQVRAQNKLILPERKIVT